MSAGSIGCTARERDRCVHIFAVRAALLPRNTAQLYPQLSPRARKEATPAATDGEGASVAPMHASARARLQHLESGWWHLPEVDVVVVLLRLLTSRGAHRPKVEVRKLGDILRRWLGSLFWRRA